MTVVTLEEAKNRIEELARLAASGGVGCSISQLRRKRGPDEALGGPTATYNQGPIVRRAVVVAVPIAVAASAS